MRPYHQIASAALVLLLVVALPALSTESQRPFFFDECRGLSVRVGDLPASLKPSKDILKAAIETQLRTAGFLARTETDLTMRLHIVELPVRHSYAYMVNLDLFHRMDNHEYGSGEVILWGTLGIEGYRSESEVVRGLARFADELTASFVADYRADGCRRLGREKD